MPLLLPIVFYAIMMGSAVATISEVYGEPQRATGITERLVDLLNVESEILVRCGEKNQEDSAQIFRTQLALESVYFNYPSRPDQPAIRGLNLNVPEGKSLALVGTSGAGKSRLLELLQRFYDPCGGRITLDEIDIRDMATAPCAGKQPVTGDVAMDTRR